jgi:hypothetical protein
MCIQKHSCSWIFLCIGEGQIIMSHWIFRDRLGFWWNNSWSGRNQDRLFCNINSNVICTVYSWMQLGEFLGKETDSNCMLLTHWVTPWNFMKFSLVVIPGGSSQLPHNFEFNSTLNQLIPVHIISLRIATLNVTQQRLVVLFHILDVPFQNGCRRIWWPDLGFS